jgi:cytochrome c-type biogenesis protein CcmF
MRVLGELCLLTSLVATGYAALLLLWPYHKPARLRQRTTLWATGISLAGLTITIGILIFALVYRDFRFEYVAQYASVFLPRRYCLAALWVGQAGSLLLWTWMTALVAVILRVVPAPDVQLRNTAFGLVMANVFFLLCVIVFAADPMAPSVITGNEGAGLSPLLQHPSMLIHPPVVFLAYAVWTIPCALVLAALILNRIDLSTTHLARPWALTGWMLLGVGLLLGAHWAYQELGWGGYWGWDPVENGSLLPWLTGTAFIHSLMVCRHRGAMKRTVIALGVTTFALCNFATFLTRSGIFSSVHAFSESPIGWMFLGMMSLLLCITITMVIRRRKVLRSEMAIRSLLAREALIIVSIFLVLSLAAVVFAGTLVAPLSKIFFGRVMEVGPAFYNNVLPPIGLCLLLMTAMVPLLRWGAPPSAVEIRLLSISFAIAVVAAIASWGAGLRHPLFVVVVGLMVFTVACLTSAYIRDASQSGKPFSRMRAFGVLRKGHRKYAAYGIHVGFVLVALGVTGSSLGTQRKQLTLNEGDVIDWAGQRIQYLRLEQHQRPDKLIAEAVLGVGDESQGVELRPARQLHLLQNEWTTEVAIHSTWARDLYTVLDAGLGGGRIALTMITNPTIRWIWVGGMISTLSAIIALLPVRRLPIATAHTLDSTGDQPRICDPNCAAAA